MQSPRMQTTSFNNIPSDLCGQLNKLLTENALKPKKKWEENGDKAARNAQKQLFLSHFWIFYLIPYRSSGEL